MKVNWYSNGHHVEAEYFEDESIYGQTYFHGTKKKFDRNNPPACPNCKLKPIKQEDGQFIDGCLGRLPGVNFACCGHGKENGYISFENGTVIRFKMTGIDGKIGKI